MVSLAYNQISALVFKRMIKYSWHACSYADNHAGPFDSVKDVCFKFDKTIYTGTTCDSYSFIFCSWRRKTLCFVHFFVYFHFHYPSLMNRLVIVNENNNHYTVYRLIHLPRKQKNSLAQN